MTKSTAKNTQVAQAGSSPASEKGAPRQSLFARVPPQVMLLVFLAALLVYFSSASDFFLAFGNLKNILIAVAVLGILAAPSTMLLVAGNVDLSVASVAAFAGMAVAMASNGGEGSLLMGVLAGLGAGLLAGVINGLIVTGIGINSLITTLGGLSIYRGITKLMSNGQTVRVSGFSPLGSGSILGVPVPVIIFIIVAAVFAFVMRYTTFGRNVYAIGANPEAARLAGIRTSRQLFYVFALTGLMAGLAGLVLTGQLQAASPVSGLGLELSVVAAVILGGASLAGGRGTIAGTVLGILILGTLNNGMTILNVSSFWQEIARGAVLILAVGFDQVRIRLGGAA